MRNRLTVRSAAQFRTIFHLCYPKTGNSINSFIPKNDYSLQYTTIDNAISAIQRLGRGTYIAKTDILSAFRLFPVHLQDWELLGMKRKNKYYFDKVLPFGLRRAPSIFNQLSDAIEWILASPSVFDRFTGKGLAENTGFTGYQLLTYINYR